MITEEQGEQIIHHHLAIVECVRDIAVALHEGDDLALKRARAAHKVANNTFAEYLAGITSI